MKTPEEIADERITENYADLQVSLDMSAPVDCIHCGKPVEWVYDGVISDWKHAEPDEFGYTYWHCSEGESVNEAEAPAGTPHP